MSQIGSCVRLKATSDIDNIIERGVYFIDDANLAQNLPNIPLYQEAYLRVYNDNSDKRRSFQSICCSYKRHQSLELYRIRNTSTNDWSSWNLKERVMDGDYSIYVSKDGDDTNFGFTSETPIQSMPELIRRLRNVKINPTNAIYVYVGEGTWDWNVQLYSCPYLLNFIGDETNKTHFIKLAFINSHVNLTNIKVDTLNMIKSRVVSVDNNEFSHVVVNNSLLDLVRSYSVNDNVAGNAYFNVMAGGRLVITSNDCTFNGTPKSYFIQSNAGFIEPNATNNYSGSYTGAKFAAGINTRIDGNGSSIDKIPGVGFHGNYTINSSPAFLYLNVTPGGDNVYSIGNASLRWKDIYATNGTIQTSDERKKTSITSIPDAVLEAWGEVNFSQFQFKDAVSLKGASARLHTGMIVQKIIDVFTKHGLDPYRYGAICFDEYAARDDEEQVLVSPEKQEYVRVRDEMVEDETSPEAYKTEIKITPAVYETKIVHKDAGNIYSLRYDEALCLEAAYQRRRADKLEERIAALEAKLS